MSPADYKVNIGAAQKDVPGAGYDTNIGADQRDRPEDKILPPNAIFEGTNPIMFGVNW